MARGPKKRLDIIGNQGNIIKIDRFIWLTGNAEARRDRKGYTLFRSLRVFLLPRGDAMDRQERLAEAKADLAEIKTAISMILSGAQSYKIGTRSLTRADLATLYKQKGKMEDLIGALSGGSGGRIKRVIPLG